MTASFAMPFAIAPSQRAVAGATTIASAVSATTMCPMRWSGSSPRTSVSTACRDSAWNVSGPTNVAADGVSITTTSAPSARSSRTSSTALYAAIEPQTPRPMSRPSSRPVTVSPRRPGRPRAATIGLEVEQGEGIGIVVVRANASTGVRVRVRLAVGVAARDLGVEDREALEREVRVDHGRRRRRRAPTAPRPARR